MIKIVACITQQHDWRLLLLAAAVCTFLCALTMAIVALRPAASTGRGLRAALLPGFTAGAAIWATHFIAMLAFDPGLTTGFEPMLTAGSFLIAFAFAVPSFAIALGRGRPMEGGLLLGAGVGLMHYSGMAAFRTQGVLTWDAVYVAASLGLGLPLAAVAFACMVRKGWRWQAAAVAVLTLAICSLHFTGMAAVTILPDPTIEVVGSTLSHGVIAASAAASIVVGVIVTVVLTFVAQARRVTLGHLREAISALSDGIAIFDLDRTLVTWNERFGTVAGVRKGVVVGTAQEALACEVLARLADDPANDPLLLAMLGDGAAAETAIERQTRDGGWLRIRNHKAAHGGAVWVFTDVTLEQAARRDATARQQVLERDKESAEAASQAKSRFLAMVSHELRTPMNGVLGMAHALSLTGLDERQQEYVRTLIRSGDGLMTVLDDVLDLAKIEAGRFEIETAAFDLQDLLLGVRDLWAAKAEAKGLAFELTLSEDLPQWVAGDAVRVRQVVLNLISNALKFTETGRVSIRAVCGGPEGRVSISVTDTGPGIDAATQVRLFQDFAQATPDMAKRFGGTGLGLSISRKLAQLMGGELQLESQVGEGSTFTLCLPLPPTEPAEIVRVEPGEEAALPRRVLAVDDNPTNLLVARTLLESLGCEVATAESGREALALLAATSFDAVLMDIQMPEMDGYEALNRLRALGEAAARTPVVALTANAMAGERERNLAAGFDDYLSKPIRPDALVQVLSRVATSTAATALVALSG